MSSWVRRRSPMVREARARRDQPADDDVLLQAAQVVLQAADGRLGEHRAWSPGTTPPR